RRPVVTHQAGAKQIDALQENYAKAGVSGELLPFIDDMAERYGAADVVLCRAGALTVAELAVAGAASILVPLPHAVDDHQTGNARFLSDRDGAILLPQPELTPERLAELLGSLSRERLLGMALHARALARPEATSKVAALCEAAASTGKS
ncbi:MAG: UDP-N-acetylglucosamine--N-acetylmuramyl-(pentapeptide) pyrophosphoryl-undecaprenol N-acetylglucosamine transferase, partial [Rhodocyclaceae bacterium]|nr:UDP-N-acetylglucosamine--N-acetylmuramyl-(pentapeptide) pyrophosphoryl-undecaprenol N-acetylglucosamine transferase [Rhodocyclaceae bacterium]